MLPCETTHKNKGPDLFAFIFLLEINGLDCDTCLSRRGGERDIFEFEIELNTKLQNQQLPTITLPPQFIDTTL